MNSRVWKVIYQTIRKVERVIPRTMRKCPYSDALIVAMYLWTVSHDRPMCWGADRDNYHGPFRPRRLPSRSQFGRRIASARCASILKEVNERLAATDDIPRVLLMDGRALQVGPYSQDADARSGRVGGGFGRGFKLHALATIQGQIVDWRVTSLNVSEKVFAEELLQSAPPRTVVLADGYYDSSKLYDLASAKGARLFTPLPENACQGHRVQSQARLKALRIWERCGATLYKIRTAIERHFSAMSSFGGGLAPLPPWVRTLSRVTRWVAAKLVIYHARLLLRLGVA